MKGRAGDRKRSPANRSLFGPVDHNQNKLDVSRIWTRLNEGARTRVVDPTTDLESGTRGGGAGARRSTDEEEGGVDDDAWNRTRDGSPSRELLRIGPGESEHEFVPRSGTPGDACAEGGVVSSAESLISRRLIVSKPTCVTIRDNSVRSGTSSSPPSSSSSVASSVTTSVLNSSDRPWRTPVKHRRGDEAPALERPSLRPPDVEERRGELNRRPMRPPPAEEKEFRRIPVVQLAVGGDGVCPQEAQGQKKCFFKPIRSSTGRRSSEDEEGCSRDDEGLPVTEMTTKRKRKHDGEGGDDDDDEEEEEDGDEDGDRASCWVQSAVRSGSEMFGDPGIKSEILNRRLNEIAIPKKRTLKDNDDDKTQL